MTTLDELEKLKEAATKYFALPVSGDEGCMKIWDAQTRLIADVRSWGYLTGKGAGALGLSDEEALKVQRELMAFIVAAINALPELLESAEAPGRAKVRRIEQGKTQADRRSRAKAAGKHKQIASAGFSRVWKKKLNGTTVRRET
jgi:hypothetical protein